MKGQMDTEMGKIFVDEDVLLVCRFRSVDVLLLVASVNVRDGFVKLLKKDNLRHGVNVSVADGKLMIELHIIVAYEVSILAVAQNLVDNVKYKVEEYTGMEVGKITVCVEGVRVIN
ncbi:MAG: Asp23/Gls24 family envelope stress response protein [Clostridium sp.]